MIIGLGLRLWVIKLLLRDDTGAIGWANFADSKPWLYKYPSLVNIQTVEPVMLRVVIVEVDDVFKGRCRVLVFCG